MNTLTRAYEIIFEEEPKNMERWQMAKEIMDNFNVQKLGEELAKEAILEIVNHVEFPTLEMTRKVVGHAENLATELFDEFNKPGKEPHMAELEYLEFKKNKIK